MDQFLKELMDLITIESNNGDYYLEGYVNGSTLSELINKHFPEYEFTDYNTYCRWYPPSPPKEGTFSRFISSVYGPHIVEQLTNNLNSLSSLERRISE